MERDLKDSVVHNTSSSNESENDKSFVGKVKSIISNTPLSKWFRKQDDNKPIIRRRDEVFEDEDISEIQPPSKKVKLPANNEGSNCNSILYNETCNSATNDISNNVNVFNKIPEPVAGPSGLRSHKLVSRNTPIAANSARCTFSSNELLSGHSDSEESTSGYSSVARIGSKEQVCGSQESSKQTSPLQTSPRNPRSLFQKPSTSSNRSLFADRSLSPNMNTSLSSRRPNFNASAFGSPNFVDKTLSTKRIINSPFYNGKTIYGGASAYGRSLGRSSQDLKTSLRNSVHITPVNKTTTENGNLMLGKTARRILDTIEQYSSPINDAKKIPIVSKKIRQNGLLTKYTGANPYMVREAKVASNTELQVPTVSDLLRMKTRLQESTETVRQIAVSSKSDLNTEYYKIPTKEGEKEKHTGKIKSKVTSVRQKNPANEIVHEVKLTPVSLPITTLPKFDFVIPPPTTIVSETRNITTTETQTFITKLPNAQSTPKTVHRTETNVHKEKHTTTTTFMEYKFSDPLVVAENMKSIVAINNFKFSEPPLCTKSMQDFSKNLILNFKMPDNIAPLNKKVTSELPQVKPAKMLSTGSVMDILGKKDSSSKDSLLEKFKPAQGTWECTVCMIRNQPDKTRCAACETPKAEVNKQQTENKNSFGANFKLSSDKWECSACMLHNNNSESKCVSCTTPKPKPKSNSVATKETKPVTSVASGFGDKFKPPSSTWECGTCMIRNKSELTKCAACETPNPKATQSSGSPNKVQPINKITNQQSGFGSTFKVKDDEWECSTCMVRNKASNVKCLCCETPNPKSTSSNTPIVGITGDKKTISSFNFGIDKNAATSFNFGIPATAAKDSVSKTDTNVTSIFGNTNAKPATSNAPVQFSFGIPAPGKTEQAKTTEPSSVPPPESTKPNETTSVLTFTANNPLLKSKEKQEEKTEKVPTEFKFGGNSTSIPQTTNKEASVLKSTAPVTAADDKPKPLFNFKSATSTINGDINNSLFGNKANTSVSAASTSKPVFAFGAKPAAVAAPLIPTGTTQASQSVPAKPMFKFGSTTSTATENSSFGSTNSMTTSVNNGFVTKSTPSFAMSNTGSAEKPSTTQIKPFTFGSTAKESSEPASKVPMFSFGQSASSVEATPAAKAPGFNFGSSTAPSFNFSTAAKTENTTFRSAAATPATTSMFGASPASSGQNGTFNFGNIASSNNNQKASFSFGAAAANNTTGPGFNFGASAPTFAPPSGGFNFSSATPAFNASTKPSFNFTDGNVTAFSAQPSADGSITAPRKIKRAVRRTQR